MLLLTLKGRSTQLGDIQRHSTGYLYSAINFLVPASFMFFAAWLRSRRFYLFTLTVLAGGPFLLLGLTQGSRIGLLPALLGLGIIYYLHERTASKVRNVLILGVLTVGVLAFIRDFRDADSIGRRSLDSMEFTNHPVVLEIPSVVMTMRCSTRWPTQFSRSSGSHSISPGVRLPRSGNPSIAKNPIPGQASRS